MKDIFQFSWISIKNFSVDLRFILISYENFTPLDWYERKKETLNYSLHIKNVKNFMLCRYTSFRALSHLTYPGIILKKKSYLMKRSFARSFVFFESLVARMLITFLNTTRKNACIHFVTFGVNLIKRTESEKEN